MFLTVCIGHVRTIQDGEEGNEEGEGIMDSDAFDPFQDQEQKSNEGRSSGPGRDLTTSK